ncbi:MAG: hypothetical protein D6675_13295 [Gemmatimonadetes bacterium]|nr:MAG: hypothetical protein D6675_13295 [Gemmatimonadota bacterium]
MPLEYNTENRRKALCDALQRTGIGAAVTWDGIKQERVVKVVPDAMLETFPERLLMAATQVCTSDPYGWQVDQKEPEIDEQMTFTDLDKRWFRRIVFSA